MGEFPYSGFGQQGQSCVKFSSSLSFVFSLFPLSLARSGFSYVSALPSKLLLQSAAVLCALDHSSVLSIKRYLELHLFPQGCLYCFLFDSKCSDKLIYAKEFVNDSVLSLQKMILIFQNQITRETTRNIMS